MIRILRNIAVIGLLAASVAACGGGGGGGGGSVAVTPPTASPPSIQSAFGAGFATLFNAGPNTDPAKPTTGDVIALSLTTDPLKLR
ncbi:hypothetical protein [Caulobacter sp. DWR2-3-1b2]|uniref:hypothetical protein n=1 Tax=unclassified Caulobacter TaxID=2648921 RepID=UPI0019BA1A6B|nr:hypothetical protein [Caulobacter sp.]